MINCNDNENDNEKQILWIIDLDVDMDTNKHNIACHGKVMSICNKQHVSNIWTSVHSKSNQYWG